VETADHEWLQTQELISTDMEFLTRVLMGQIRQCALEITVTNNDASANNRASVCVVTISHLIFMTHKTSFSEYLWYLIFKE
jgi:hypothetical protein